MSLRPLRSRAVLLLSLGLLPLPAVSQNEPPATPPDTPAAPPPAEVVELEEFRVTTGSHLRREVDQETALPVSVLDYNQLEATNASTAIELFEYIPQAGYSDINESNTAGAVARGDVASINLRGIGSGNSLVLLNGRRIAPHPISQAENRVPSLSVNVNVLPVTIVERVEVLRDGASAVYGADAAAGVLNTITRTNYHRTEAALRLTWPEQPGADERQFRLSHGASFNQGRTYFAFAYSHFARETLFARQRDFAADADLRPMAPPPWDGWRHTVVDPLTGASVNYRDHDFDNRSSITPYGEWVTGRFDSDGNFIGVRPSNGVNTLTSSTGNLQASVHTSGGWRLIPMEDGIGFSTTNNSVTRNREDIRQNFFFNVNEYRTIMPKTRRESFYSTWTHKLGNGMELFGDMLLYDASSTAFREPLGANSTDNPGIYVPASNPWNPFGVRFYHPTGEPNADGTPRNIGTPLDVLFSPATGVRLMDIGPRRIEVESRAGRIVTGLRGTVRNWNWESAVNYSWAKTRDQEHNAVRESRLREAMARTDETAYNPFNYTFKLVEVSTTGSNRYRIYVDQPYSNPQDVIDEITDIFERVGRTSLLTWDFKVDGQLTRTWAGAVDAAAGFEYRYESYEDIRPPFHGLNPPEAVAARPDLFREGQNDFMSLSPNADIIASRDVISAYAETIIPLIAPKQRIPLIRSLELGVAARYETFSKFGDTFKPKVSLSWRPTSWILARASYNESFRAPNLVQTNPDPIQRSSSGITDYYRLGIPGAVDAPSSPRTFVRGGSDSLVPEQADTLLFGVVIDPPFLPGLSFSLDHFRLNQRDVIDAPTGTSMILEDEEFLARAARLQIEAGVPIDQLSAYTTGPNGESIYLGNPGIVRAPPTATDIEMFRQYNQNLPAGELPRVPVGPIQVIRGDYRNIAGRDISGYDIGFNWRLPQTPVGRFRLNGQATYLARFDEKLDAYTPMTDERGKNNNRKWRGNLTLFWNFSNFSNSLSWYYYGSSLETSAVMRTGTLDPVVMDATYEALGSPDYIVRTVLPSGEIRYYYKNSAWGFFSLTSRYTFRQRHGLLKGMHVRVGITNLTNVEPPITDVSNGYRGGTALARGRAFSIEVGKRF